MATWDGAYNGGGRIEYVYSVDPVWTFTTSVTVTVTAYLRMQGNNSSNGSWPMSWSGAWGSGSSSPSNSIGAGGRVQIRSWPGSVSLTDSTQSRSFQISAQHYWGTTSATLDVSIPARYALTPTNLQLDRVSDSRIDVSWTRQGTYTQTEVQFRLNTGSGWGSWSSAGTATGNVSSYQATSGIYYNRAYQFRVRSSNGHHFSGWTDATAAVYTTPKAPSTVTASRSGSNLVVRVSGLPPHGAHFDIEREGSGIVGSVIARENLPWTDTSPGTARRRYRVRARKDSGGNNSSTLISAWSGWSNYSQLLSAPSNVTPTRNSDTQTTVSWTRNSVYTSVVVQRQINSGDWQSAGTAQGNAASLTMSNSLADRRYRFRVQGRDAEGGSAWSTASGYLYTTPAAPTGVSATRVGNDIRVNVSGLGPWATHYDIEDNGIIVGSAVPRASLPWTHVGPDPSQTHRYRVRARVSSGGTSAQTLIGAYSSYSNTVQLQAPPNAPTNLSPNGGVVAAEASVRYSWRHNPVDSSEQTQYQLQYRPVGGSWTTLTGTTSNEYRDLSLTAPGSYEWEVRTRGAHATDGPWSATATVTVISVPTVAINTPDSGIWTEPTLTAAWSYVQAEGRPQTGWRVQLTNTDAGEVLVDETGTGAASSFPLPVRLVRSTYYRLRVWVANSGIWSDFDELSFETVFVPPAAPVVDAVWNEESGSHDLTVDSSVGPERDDVVNLFTNPRLKGDGTWAEVRRNLATNPRGEATDGEIPMPNSIPQAPITRAVDVPVPHPQGLTKATMQEWVSGTHLLSMYNIDRVQTGAPERMLGCWVLVTEAGYRVSSMGGFFPQVDLPANQWVFLASAIPVGPGSPSSIGVSPITGVPSATARAYLTGVVSEAGDRPVAGYWDGSTTPETSGDVDQPEDFRWRWLGTPNASESVMEIERVAGVTVSRCVAGVSTRDGKPAVRAIPTEASSTLHTSITVPIPEDARSGGTLVATLHNGGASFVSSGFRLTAQTPYHESPAVSSPGRTPLKLTFSGLTSSFFAGLRGGLSAVGSGDVWWTGIGLFAGDYDGPYFDGSSGQLRIDGTAMNADWDGAPDNSTSRLTMAEPTVRTVIERSIDGGETWETVTGSPYVDGELSVSDYEGLSMGTTLYRVTGYSVADESAEVDVSVEASSGAIRVGAGDGFSTVAVLPAQPEVNVSRGRERAAVPYWGRASPVAYASPARPLTISFTGRVTDEPIPGVLTSTRDVLEQVVDDPYPVHCYRDHRGHRVYGTLSLIGLSDIGTRRDEQGGGVWDYSLSITETSK